MTVLLFALFSKIMGYLLLLSSVAIFAWYLWYFRFFVYMKPFPRLPHVWPLLGTALQLPGAEDIYEAFKSYRGELGSVYWTMVGIEPVCMVANADLIGLILSSPKCVDKPWLYKFFYQWLSSQGIFTCSGDRWRTLRKIFMPAFHHKLVQESVEHFDSTNDWLVRKFRNEIGNVSTDVYPLVSRNSLDTICKFGMGTNMDAQDDETIPYFKSVHELTALASSRTYSVMENYAITYRFTKKYRAEKEAVKIAHNYTNSLIGKRKQSLLAANHSSKPKNDFGEKKKLAFLDFLLQYNDNNSSGVYLSDEEIRESVDTFLFAGYDTVASCLSFAVYLLANNTEIQKKAMEEIDCIFGDDMNRRTTLKDLEDMKYLELVIKETLRMYPSVPMYARRLTTNLEFDGKILPKGLAVVIATYVMHQDEKYFPNPERFDPDRFLPENVKERHPFSYVPFSAGPRCCPGQKFALLSMKATLSKILRNFELQPMNYEMVVQLQSVIKSQNGINVRIKHRKS